MRPKPITKLHRPAAPAYGRPVLITIAMAALVIFAPGPAHAAGTSEVEFNAGFLQSSGAKRADISRFSKDNVVSAGDYLVDLTLNGQWRERLTVRFVIPPGPVPDDVNANPCMTLPMLTRIGLNLAVLPPAQRAAWAKDTCIAIERIGTGAKVSFDMSTLTLSLWLPQAVLVHRPHGYVSPQSWDKGVPSATLAYDASVFRSTYAGLVTTSVYAALTAGVNLGDWHFRNRSSLTQTGGHWTYQNIAAYGQRDLPALQSSLTLGDTFTDGAVFDSFGFRGVSLATDDRMRPDSLAGYAPVVRGIARTNARVRITQHGTLLMETTVAPGAFEIDDLYPTGYGGDLLVTVLESDGNQESFAVTYASLVQLLRSHVWRYSIAAGDLQINGTRTGNTFAQATVQRGLTDAMTPYAGAQAAPGYGAGLIGVALNTPLGGVAADITVARNAVAGTGLSPAHVDQGYSVRLSYSKIVPGIRTNITLAAYRYSSGGFWSLQDAMANRRANEAGTVAAAIVRQLSRFQMNIAQSLPEHWGNLYLNGSSTRYFSSRDTVTQFQAGYNNVAAVGKLNLNYGVALSRQRDDVSARTDKRMLFNLAVALGRQSNAPRLSVNLTDDLGGQALTSGEVAINGTLGTHGEVSYGANVNVARGANAVAVNGAYRAQFATLSASASAGTHFNQASFGISGGIVVHPGGVTTAATLGDTIAIADAPGAKGASVATGTGTRIDGAGYAIVPYLMPYRENQVSIDPHDTALDVDMQITSQQVAPHANAVVMLHYPTTRGAGVMFVAHLADGTVVPFGASASVPHQPDAGIVGQNGQIFLRGIAAKGHVQVSWGLGADTHCAFDYVLPKQSASAPMIRITSTCLPD